MASANLSMMVRLTFEGAELGPRFAAFARDRLGWLGLDGRVEADASRATVTVRGATALIDMLEVACLLGPLDCRVEAVQRTRLRARSGAGAGRLLAIPAGRSTAEEGPAHGGR